MAGLLAPKLRIVLYVCFVISLFVYSSITYYVAMAAALGICLMFVPFRTLKAGWLPISLFTIFTFLGNAMNHSGMILYASGPVTITVEGIELALLKSLRLLLMIGGVKFLMAMTPTDKVISAMEGMLQPFGRIGLPVHDYFQIMGLTMKCFPVLKNTISARYREMAPDGSRRSSFEKAGFIAQLMMPLFVESIIRPEMFFAENGQNEKKD